MRVDYYINPNRSVNNHVFEYFFNHRLLFFFVRSIKTAYLSPVSEISGPAKTQTPVLTFYDEEDEVVYGSAEMDKTENKPLAVDNTVHGHMGYPSLVTPSSTIRVGKKRPIKIASSGADPYPRWLFVLVSPLLSLLVCRRW